MNIMEVKIDKKSFNEDNARFFIWSIWHFFKQSCGDDAEVGTPFLIEDFNHSDYTGVVAVSGSEKGAVYWTMSKPLLSEVMKEQFQDIIDSSEFGAKLDSMYMDYAGEMANIVAGNARNYLGEKFLISTPVVMTKNGHQIIIPDKTTGLVLPIIWRDMKCHLILAFEV